MESDGFLCRSCNYPLRGLPKPCCPECGNAFDANDLRTMNTGRPTPRWAWRWMEPIGVGFLWFVVPAAMLTLACFSVPGGYLFIFLPLFLFGWLPIGGWWILRATLAIWLHFRFAQPLYIHERKHRRWVLAPAVVVATIGALGLGLPLRLAFEFSQPAMNKLADRATRGETLPDQWVGCFYATQIRPTDDGVSFLCKWSGFMAVGGFVRGTRVSDADWEIAFQLRNGWSAALYEFF